MRLIEEKYVVRLEIISVGLILLSSTCIQIANYKIDKHQHRYLEMILNSFQKQDMSQNHQLASRFYMVFKGLGGRFDRFDPNLTENRHLDEELKRLKLEFDNGTITDKDYVDRFIKRNSDLSLQFLDDYNGIIRKLRT